MKKSKPEVIKINFNEAEIIKTCFSFSDAPKNRSNIYRMMYINQSNLKLIRLIIKYLLFVEKVDPIKVETLLFKWCVVISYYYFRTQLFYGIEVAELEELLSKDITVDILDKATITSHELFGKVFNFDEKDKKDIKKNIRLLCEHVDAYSIKIMSTDPKERYITTKNTATLLNKNNYFFTKHRGLVYTFKEEFDDYENNLSFDRLIAEVLANVNDIIEFDLLIEKEQFDKLLLNYKTKFLESNKMISLGLAVTKKTIPLLFGYMISNMIMNNNFKYEKEIKIMPRELFFITLKQGKCKVDVDFFLYEHQGYIINQNDIEECEFILNDVLYKFTKSGLIEI